MPGHVVQVAKCGPPSGKPPISPEMCDEAVPDRAAAVALLVTQPGCADAAVRKLAALSALERDARVWNDLGAAYYVRAQRQDSPTDLLRAFDAVQKAIEVNPALPEARFNLGLLQEALGFQDEAIATWSKVAASGEVGWAEEAARRRDVLFRVRTRTAALPAIESARLPLILEAGDATALNRSIEMDPEGVHRFVEREVLPAWARAATEDDAQRQLAIASTIAEAVARIMGDRYLLDSVERIMIAARQRDTAAIKALREGHLLFAVADSVPSYDMLDRFRRAESAFAKVNSPFQYRAAAAAAWLDPDASGRLVIAADYARTHRYQYLWTRLQATRAIALHSEGRLVEALHLYAQTVEGSSTGQSDVVQARAGQISLLRDLGMNELAWREAFQAAPLALNTTARSKDFLLNEVGAAASAVGYGEIGLLYQDLVIEMLRQSLSRSNPDDVAAIRVIRIRLASALGHRADIALDLGDVDRAARDTTEATGFGLRSTMLQARISELRGQRVLRTHPSKAVASFTEALTNSPLDADAAFPGDILAQRAEANRRTGNSQAAAQDLEHAISQLRAAEVALPLTRRQRPASARFAQAYRRVVLQFVEAGQSDGAFLFAEKARLFTSRPDRPRPESVPQDAMSVERVQAALPRGTVLIEYLVFDDRTLVWTLSADSFRFHVLSVGTAEIERWAKDLQFAATTRDRTAFERNLFAPYDRLLATSLQESADSQPFQSVVIVPDGAMTGLPFAALRNPTTKRYLIEDSSAAMTPSATHYVTYSLRDRAAPPPVHPQVLLMADPAIDQSLELARGFRPLPGARDEVIRIGRSYATHADSVIRVGQASTVDAFRELAPKSVVIHIAAPSISNMRNASQSFLLMAPSASNSGILTYEDVLEKVELKSTKLVVLSTCSSAAPSLGIDPSLLPANAFLGAGAAAVVGSLWAVDDWSTAYLMALFHLRYVQGDDVATALRHAQLTLLRSNRLGASSAISWGPWQVLGVGSSRLRLPSTNFLPSTNSGTDASPYR
jgi:CHAT domain-containing protein